MKDSSRHHEAPCRLLFFNPGTWPIGYCHLVPTCCLENELEQKSEAVGVVSYNNSSANVKKITRISNESHSVTESETQIQSWNYISKNKT